MNFKKVVDILGRVCKKLGLTYLHGVRGFLYFEPADLRIHNDSYEHKRWCVWAHASQRAQFSAALLLVFWSGIEAGLVRLTC